MKKIVIITTLILVVVIVVLLWLLLPEENVSTAVPPPGTQYPVVDSIQETETIIVDPETIRVRYESFLQDEGAVRVFKSFTSPQGGQIPLDQWLSALGGSMDRELYRFIDESTWNVYRCEGDPANPQIVLRTRFALQPNYVGNLYEDTRNSLEAWERNMLNGVQPVIFPQPQYGASPTRVSRFLPVPEFTSVDLRRADVEFSDGTQAEMAYLVIGDELIVGNNTACVREAQELVYDTSA